MNNKEDWFKIMMGAITVIIVAGFFMFSFYNKGLTKGYDFARYENQQGKVLTSFDYNRYILYEELVHPRRYTPYDYYDYNLNRDNRLGGVKNGSKTKYYK